MTATGLKMMVKSGLENFILKSHHAQETIFLHFIKGPKITNSVIKITIFPHGGISKYFFSRPKMVFLDTDSILRVKPMYESIK